MNNEGYSFADVIQQAAIPDPQTAINTSNIATNTSNIATNTSNIATNTAATTALNTRTGLEFARTRSKTGTMEAVHLTTAGSSTFTCNDNVKISGRDDIFILGLGFRPNELRNPVSKVTSTTKPVGNTPIVFLAVADFRPLLTVLDTPYGLLTELTVSTVDRLFTVEVEFELDFVLTGAQLQSGAQRLTFQSFVNIIGRDAANGNRLLDKNAFSLTTIITSPTQPQKRRHRELFSFIIGPGITRIELVPSYNNSASFASTEPLVMTGLVSSDDQQICRMKATVMDLSFSP
jgi:hypothetical protein